MSKLLLTASALALVTGPAAALTAPELWADWQETLAGLGTELTAASEDYSDGTLALTGITAIGDLGGTASETTYGDMSLVEQDDGSVRVELPPRMEQTTMVEVDGEQVETAIIITHAGLDYVVRDEGDTRVYDGRADRLTYELDDLSGQEGEDFAMTMTMTDIDSVTRIAPDDTYEGTVAGGLVVTLSSGGAEPFDMTYTLAELDGDITGTLPDTLPGADITNLSDTGLSYDFDLTHNGSTLSMTADTAEGPLAVEGTSSGGRLSNSLSPESLAYEFASTDAAVTVTPPGFPLPVNGTLAEMAFAVDIPIAEGEEAAPFAMSATLRELTLDDQIWSLFDPTGQLPRDPATVEIELDGTATVLASLFDANAMQNMAGPPALPETLNITNVLVSMVGAELTGSGALTFPNPAVNPMPEGKISLALDGGYALLDRIVALGFVPQQQALLFRGLAGAVTEQVGDDQLRSEIEFTPTGILANGNPLPF